MYSDYGARGPRFQVVSPRSPISTSSEYSPPRDTRIISLPTTVSNQQSNTIPSNINKHSVHWYDDGNLLVVVDGVHFKVYWALMAKGSTFFREQHDSWKNDHSKTNLMNGKEAVNLDGKCISAEDLAELLNFVHLSSPHQLDDRHTLKTILSVLAASHALSFPQYLQWAKERLIPFWSIDNNLEDLSILIDCTPEDARKTFTISQRAQIRETFKPSFYAVLRLPLFGLENPLNDGWEGDVNFVRCRELLNAFWKTTLHRLQLHSCVDQRAIPTSSSKSSCASNDVTKSDLIHFHLLYKNGIYHEFVNDPLLGLRRLQNQLIPSTPLPLTIPTDMGSLFENLQMPVSSSGVNPTVSPWAETQVVGGYCEDCRMRMWKICSEAMAECWTNLDRWAGLWKGEEERFDVDTV